MARYELRLYMRNACGPPLLGDVAVIEAADEGAAASEAASRVRQLPKRCFGALFDPMGVQIWADDAPDAGVR
jgi:hypothetical protein